MVVTAVAPGGSDWIEMCSWVPRVTVAQAPSMEQAAAIKADERPCFTDHPRFQSWFLVPEHLG